MANPARTPGLRGRLPVKPAAERFALRYLSDYVTLPAPSYPVDVSGGITDFGMLGNGPDPTCTTHPDGVGDCTFAGRQHLRMTKAAAGGETETWESSNDLVAEYLQYDHGQDEGANIADLLLAWYKAGKILAFAPVDHTSPAQVDAAMQAFHGCYAGVSLTDDADQRFSDGQPWTVSQGQQPDPNEGHCIVKVGAQAGSSAVGHFYDTWVTWGATQRSTRAWTNACLDEAWAIITSEDEIDPAALAALRADIDALHGTGGQPPQPAPSPAPAPPPAPAPVPDPASLLAELAAMVREVAANVDRDIAEAVAWLGSHGL
jgi:hypothetical protein